MNRKLDESELVQKLAALPAEITPQRDVWPQISARIAPAASSGTHRFRVWPLATAASFLVVLTAGLLLKNHWNPSESISPRSDPAVVTISPQGSAYYAGSSSTTGELEYQAALREFMALNMMSGAGEGLKPKWIERGWDTLRQVELELTAALRDEPDNDFLNSRLVVLRARQIELLKQIAAVDSASWRNNI